MTSPSPANLRAFVRRQTRLQELPDLPEVRLHLADDVTRMWRLAGDELHHPDPPLPFWAFAWAGGLAIVSHLVEHPDEVRGRRVLDLASGSGLCAIVAARLGAASVLAADVDPLSEAAVAVNARANGVRIAFTRDDLLSAPPSDFDAILAGDVCYEETMGRRMIEWLRVAAGRGTRVLLGDPGRRYLPDGLERLGAYRVHTSRELEDAETKESWVYTIGPDASPAGRVAAGQ